MIGLSLTSDPEQICAAPHVNDWRILNGIFWVRRTGAEPVLPGAENGTWATHAAG